ncbi:hypothetical protein IV203_036778 [Nitzschia inconspicua]|uniref:Uncharacterized protein n=1 Tax=Nitzschia inconspicua TaxID=303405 RepID=A0A9K3PVV5_9STRA|nr:hypothetical protein IV203_036778 [Nitzschia inconspicua]
MKKTLLILPISVSRKSKEALVDILDNYPRQYFDVATGSTTPCTSGGLFRQIAYLASEQLFEGRDVGKVVPDELLQNFEKYVKTYIENSRTETTSTLTECGNCRTWNVSPGGFIFPKSEQFYCWFLGRTCFGGSSHRNTLCLAKKKEDIQKGIRNGASTTPHPQDLAINPTTAQRMTTGRLWRNGVGYVVPVSVVEDFPYWLGGWECLLCQQKTVVSIKNHCFECKKVFCYTCIQNKNGSNFVRETDPDTGSEIDRCTSCSVRLGNQSQPTNRLSKQLLASSRTSVTPYWEGTGSSTSRKCRAEENVVFGLRKMQPQQKSDVDGQDGCSLEE